MSTVMNKKGINNMFAVFYKYSLRGIAIAITFLLFACGTNDFIIRDVRIIEKTESQTVETQADTVETQTEQAQEDEIEQIEDLEDKYIKNLEERYKGRANGITTYYNNAQQYFYVSNFSAALYHINKAAEIQETSDILALRGSIYLALGARQAFIQNWKRALKMDENVPIPNVNFIITALKAEGLINENYNPGF